MSDWRSEPMSDFLHLLLGFGIGVGLVLVGMALMFAISAAADWWHSR